MSSSNRPSSSKSLDPVLQLGTRGLFRRPFELAVADARRHVLVTGEVGAGRHLLIESMLVQQTQLGLGYVVLDPAGNTGLRDQLFSAACAAGRADEFVVVDFDSPERSHTLALLADSPDMVAGELLQVLPQADSPGGDYYRQLCNYALTVVLSALHASGKQFTLLDVISALHQPAALTTLEAALADSPARTHLRLFMDQFRSADGSLVAEKLTAELGGLASRLFPLTQGALGAILNSPSPETSLTDIVASNRLCYISLPTLGKDSVALALGRLLTGKLLHAAWTRRLLPQRLRNQPTLLVFERLDTYAPSWLEAAYANAGPAGIGVMASLTEPAAQLEATQKARQVIADYSATKVYFKQARSNVPTELNDLPTGHFVVSQDGAPGVRARMPAHKKPAYVYQKPLTYFVPESLRPAIRLADFMLPAEPVMVSPGEPPTEEPK